MASYQRGVTRSGGRFAVRNKVYYSSVGEVLFHHPRLREETPVFTTRVARIAGLSSGSLEQTTARFKFGYPHILPALTREFLERFREHSEGYSEGYEVVVTFNAILQNLDSSTYSLFYGQDHRADNIDGAAKELKYGNTILVKSMLDVPKIPTFFDADTILRSHQHAFESSNVKIHSFLNVVYLIYRYCESKNRKTNHGEQEQYNDKLPRGDGASKRARVN